MIYYYSGTGNSAYVASKLGEYLKTDSIDLGERIRSGTMDDIDDATAIIVTPTYCWRVPRLVENYLRQIKVSAERIYFVMTCGGGIGNAEKYAKVLAKDIGVSYGGIFSVVMPENYVAMFDVPGVSESREIVARAEEKIERIAACIARGEFHREPVKFSGRFGSLINGAFYALFVKADPFYATDACIGCGECERRCVLANVVMEDGRPVWLDRCTHCMACINHCPVEAIEYGKKTQGKFRYTFEKIREKHV
ncbi:MAG: EFR1 family ferrodoxin [Peptoniphilus sp.]|nr:EFR1 family ferrodoxin [Peptoniphilus sp.]MDD7363044.1 EFR1 family ferrodoxin [Bacillota bacterium]MDY6045309.1 EFR1 family ferrodoxin [Peptoniphilus sp.]